MTTDEKIDCLLEKMDHVRTWQATHTEKHDAISLMLKMHSDELYGVAGSLVPGLKAHVQTISDQISLSSRWVRLLDSIIANVASGGAIALIIWLLWMYSQHAK